MTPEELRRFQTLATSAQNCRSLHSYADLRPIPPFSEWPYEKQVQHFRDIQNAWRPLGSGTETPPSPVVAENLPRRLWRKLVRLFHRDR